MKIMRRILGAVIALSLGALMMFPVPVSAAEGTEGSEMQVIQPEQLEIQLGADWAGVEFELKTDSGMYPGTIPVSEDGVLRLEIGGSSTYILTCLNSAVSAPEPAQAPAATQTPQENIADTTDTEGADADTDPAEAEPDATQENGDETISVTEGEEATVAGIPVLHLALFGGGMVLAIGSLIVMYIMKKRSVVDADYEEEDEE